MPPTPSQTDREDIIQAHHAYSDAMAEGDAQPLDDLRCMATGPA